MHTHLSYISFVCTHISPELLGTPGGTPWGRPLLTGRDKPPHGKNKGHKRHEPDP